MTVNQFDLNNNSAAKIIHLAGQQPLNSGFYRDTYVHPDDAKLILKIPRRNLEQTRKGVFGLGRNLAKNPNQLEFETWGELAAAGHDDSGYFSPVLGWLETDIGRALCVERLISDADFPPIILKSLQREQAVALDSTTRIFILSGLDKFFEYVTEHAIYSCAWRLENIAVCRQEGKLVLKSFDTKAITVREWLPLSKYLKFARRQKIRRRTDKLRQYMQAMLSLDEIGNHP
jgi:hypothetical protein